METTISRRYHFESAHFLPKVADGHRCKRMHGHNYKMDVLVAGELDECGFVIDFWDLDAIVKPIIEKVDHRCLNEIDGLENPTAELIAEWFYAEIEEALEKHERAYLARITIWETDECAAHYVSED